MGEMFTPPPHPGLSMKDTVLREVWSTVRRQSALSWRYAWRHCSMSLLVRGSRCKLSTICGSYAINGGRRFGA
jgi:hypothetical protein